MSRTTGPSSQNSNAEAGCLTLGPGQDQPALVPSGPCYMLIAYAKAVVASLWLSLSFFLTMRGHDYMPAGGSFCKCRTTR